MDQQLSALLNDPSPVVRRAAVNAALKIDSNVFIPKLFYMLFDRDVSFDVAKVLSKLGEKIIGPASDILSNKLESYRLKSEVAKMLGDIYTQESFRLLVLSLDTESDELRNIVLNSLKKLLSKIEKASPVFSDTLLLCSDTEKFEDRLSDRCHGDKARQLLSAYFLNTFADVRQLAF